METMKTNNYLNALFSIVFGVVFVAIPEQIALILPLYLLIYLAYRAGFELFKVIKSKEKKDKIKGFVVAGIDVIIAICIIIFREWVNDVVAILMAINTLTEIAECMYEIISDKGKNKKIALNIILAIIHSILFIALITELGESVVNHIAIYGISFAVRGFKSISDNIKEQIGKGSLKKVIQNQKHLKF